MKRSTWRRRVVLGLVALALVSMCAWTTPTASAEGEAGECKKVKVGGKLVYVGSTVSYRLEGVVSAAPKGKVLLMDLTRATNLCDSSDISVAAPRDSASVFIKYPKKGNVRFEDKLGKITSADQLTAGDRVSVTGRSVGKFSWEVFLDKTKPQHVVVRTAAASQ